MAPERFARQIAPSVAVRRDLAALNLVAHGHTNAELAGQLHLSEATVKTHVARILGKLGLRATASRRSSSRTRRVWWALRAGAGVAFPGRTLSGQLYIMYIIESEVGRVRTDERTRASGGVISHPT